MNSLIVSSSEEDGELFSLQEMLGTIKCWKSYSVCSYGLFVNPLSNFVADSNWARKLKFKSSGGIHLSHYFLKGGYTMTIMPTRVSVTHRQSWRFYPVFSYTARECGIVTLILSSYAYDKVLPEIMVLSLSPIDGLIMVNLCGAWH
ncbi:hypothetical protein CEXT_396841 [Caerostris extrusa]|uniref:Uncharacterized protein n=1 Tax=Caerostris extrusa TaxID=172846 RepID=A0AAV4VP59_CAEEX|nr:hypothetical protein CEXT_396841 [Caerostris extrusa]